MLWIRERPKIVASAPPVPGWPPADEVRLRDWVEHLAVPRHRLANPKNNAWVREELARVLSDFGLDVTVQGRYKNVLALPRGTSKQPLVLIGAHYDTVPDCPGADDNASGLAVMLECARLNAKSGMHPALGFIAFNGEEDGLLGSHDFVKSGLGLLARPLAAMHVLEMVGFRRREGVLQDLPLPLRLLPAALRVPDYLGMVCRGPSNSVAAGALSASASPGLRLLTARTWGFAHRLLPDITRSDHYPFWKARLPAVLWTDTGNFRNPNYHRPSDRPSTLDYGFMREVVELLCAVV